ARICAKLSGVADSTRTMNALSSNIGVTPSVGLIACTLKTAVHEGNHEISQGRLLNRALRITPSWETRCGPLNTPRQGYLNGGDYISLSAAYIVAISGCQIVALTVSRAPHFSGDVTSTDPRRLSKLKSRANTKRSAITWHPDPSRGNPA